MAGSAAERLLAELEDVRRLRPGATRAERLLEALVAVDLDDARLLVRLHEALLFLRAYPHSRAVLRGSEKLLRSFGARVRRLKASGADVAPLEEREVSGIAGTAIEMIFSFDFAKGLVARHPRSVSIDWDGYEGGERLGAALPPFVPLLEEEALADANVPYPSWVDAARPSNERDASWLLSRLDHSPLTEREKADRYDALGLWLRWELGDGGATRTRMRRPAPRPFFGDGPLLSRRDVSLDGELGGPRLLVRTLPAREGRVAIDLCQEAMGTRYRELYAFNYGDPSNVVSADAGRGLELLVVGIRPERRLPLRAGFGTAFFRNGVPIGYGDAYAFFDRLDVAFNIFSAFRDGESAFVYARLLRLFRQLLGTSTFSADPFQIGLGNDEALDSGAFWFYRKLGFHSSDPEIERAAFREEARAKAKPGHRTGRAALERLAGASLLREAPGMPPAWDRFRLAKLIQRPARKMAASGLDAEAWRAAAERRVAGAIGFRPAGASPEMLRAFRGLAPVLNLVSDLSSWAEGEKVALLEAIREKGGPREQRFLAALGRLPRLRRALLRLGSVG